MSSSLYGFFKAYWDVGMCPPSLFPLSVSLFYYRKRQDLWDESLKDALDHCIELYL